MDADEYSPYPVPIWVDTITGSYGGDPASLRVLWLEEKELIKFQDEMSDTQRASFAAEHGERFSETDSSIF